MNRNVHHYCRNISYLPYSILELINTKSGALGPQFLTHDAMHNSSLCRRAVSVCLSVRPSRTWLVYSAETRKHIFEICSQLGSHTILVFPYQTLWESSDGDLLTGIKIAILDQRLASSHAVNGAMSGVINRLPPNHKFVTLIAGEVCVQLFQVRHTLLYFYGHGHLLPHDAMWLIEL